MRQQGLSMGRVEWTLLVILAALWGTTFFWAEIALREVPPFTVVLARVGLAALVLTLFAWAKGYRLPSKLGAWFPFVVMSTLNGWLPFSLIFWGQTQLSSSVTAIFNSTVPLFAIVLAHFLTQDERMTSNKLAGVLMGAGGVVLMFGPQAMGGWNASVLAQCALLVANVAYALAAIFAKRFKTYPPLVSAGAQMICATVCILPIALLYDRPWTLAMPSFPAVGSLFMLATIATALAYVLYFRILATAGAINLLLVTLLIPVVAIVLGVALLGETLALRHVVGMGIIALALLIVDGRPVRLFGRGRGFGSPGVRGSA